MYMYKFRCNVPFKFLIFFSRKKKMRVGQYYAVMAIHFKEWFWWTYCFILTRAPYLQCRETTKNTFFTFHVFRRATRQNILVPILSKRTLSVSHPKLFLCAEVTLHKLITVIRVRIESDSIDHFTVVTGPYTWRHCGRKWWSSALWRCGGSGSCGWHWRGAGSACGD